ncbi:hypothetical protein [Oceanobacillus sojae]|uniref:hypothetical protein n=1 Tax=Oceanobacillus sojae TaxID=582851 RepID=UPI0009883CA1|nr:hypothetical protein [Oceanobacillus sojae]
MSSSKELGHSLTIKKAKEIRHLYPDDFFAKGYNFGITTDARNKITLIKVIGWDKALKNMKYILFIAETGEFYDEFEIEQYR